MIIDKDNNQEGRQEGFPDLSEMIKKTIDTMSHGKGGKPLLFILIFHIYL